MSDSGRQIGDCRHGETREYCWRCQQYRIDKLEVEVATLKTTLNELTIKLSELADEEIRRLEKEIANARI